MKSVQRIITLLSLITLSLSAGKLSKEEQLRKNALRSLTDSLSENNKKLTNFTFEVLKKQNSEVFGKVIEELALDQFANLKKSLENKRYPSESIHLFFKHTLVKKHLNTTLFIAPYKGNEGMLFLDWLMLANKKDPLISYMQSLGYRAQTVQGRHRLKELEASKK
jgi:hypothetical protein